MDHVLDSTIWEQVSYNISITCISVHVFFSQFLQYNIVEPRYNASNGRSMWITLYGGLRYSEGNSCVKDVNVNFLKFWLSTLYYGLQSFSANFDCCNEHSLRRLFSEIFSFNCFFLHFRFISFSFGQIFTKILRRWTSDSVLTYQWQVFSQTFWDNSDIALLAIFWDARRNNILTTPRDTYPNSNDMASQISQAQLTTQHTNNHRYN